MVVVGEQVVAQESGEERREGSSNYETVSFFPTNGGVLQKEIASLIDGTEYAFQVQACNSVDCGSWSSSGYGTPIGPPNQVSVPTLKPGDGELTVIWTAPNNGGAAITGYGIRYGIAPNPPSWTGITPSGLSTQYTIAPIPGLTNGTTYKVQVRACNRPEGCGDWSMSAMGIPVAPKLAAPTDLVITPLSMRRAELKWTGDPDAHTYMVFVKDPASRVGSTRWIQVSDSSLSVEIHIIELDKVQPYVDPILGFANKDSFDLRVDARHATDSTRNSEVSDEITIVDNPLLLAGGKAMASGSSQAKLEWTPDANASNYEIRYRPLGVGDGNSDVPHHTSLGWSEGLLWPYYGEAQTVDQDTPGNKTVRGLTEVDIYAFQVKYEKDGKDVFSARDAYVWPSSDFPGEGDRVATYPFFGHHEGREFKYVICDSTFKDQQAKWLQVIQAAFSEWAKATDEWVEVIHDGSASCNTAPVYAPLTESFIIQDDDQNDIRMFDLTRAVGASGIDRAYKFPEMRSDAFKFCVTQGDACVTSWHGYSGLPYQNPETRQLFANLIRKGANLTISRAETAQLHELVTEARRNGQRASKFLQGVDVSFNQERFKTSNPVNVPNTAQFNTCLPDLSSNSTDPDDQYKAYTVAVHEAGHALELSYFDYDPITVSWLEGFLYKLIGLKLDFEQPCEAAHTTIPDSVMSYDINAKDEMNPLIRHPDVQSDFAEPDCSPHPFDVMAIYALYQNAPK